MTKLYHYTSTNNAHIHTHTPLTIVQRGAHYILQIFLHNIRYLSDYLSFSLIGTTPCFKAGNITPTVNCVRLRN